MPLHDWNRVPAGLYHHFHQAWSMSICNTLNRGRLPDDFLALIEQRSGPAEPDVLTVETREGESAAWQEIGGSTATLVKPTATYIRRTEKGTYARKGNQIAIKHHLGRTVAIIEIVSPGNKDSRGALTAFVNKTADFISSGIHVLVIDPFPPTRRDPHGIHKAIWDEFEDEDFVFPPGKDRIIASYKAGGEKIAYVEPIGLGQSLPDMPLFLTEGYHVMTPLEATYCEAWEVCPPYFRKVVETGVLPFVDEDS